MSYWHPVQIDDLNEDSIDVRKINSKILDCIHDLIRRRNKPWQDQIEKKNRNSFDHFKVVLTHSLVAYSTELNFVFFHT